MIFETDRLMGRRFLKLRISKLFQSCRSKHSTSTLPSTPVPPSLSKPHHSSLIRHVYSAFKSIGCGSTSESVLSADRRTQSPDQTTFHWEREDNLHVVAKLYYDDRNSSFSGGGIDVFAPPPPPPPTGEKKKRRPVKKKKKKTIPRIRISTSSAESGLFSSEGLDDEISEEETETLVSSSRSFLTDSSSELNQHLATIREKPYTSSSSGRRQMKKNSRRKVKKLKQCVSKTYSSCGSLMASPQESESPARLSVFQKLIPCTVDGKVRESFAVVKKSEDPYEDFKRSMMEMILEKQMFDEKDLEQLLHCFLSLNDGGHHGVIVQAFSEIWEVLFCCRRSSSRRSSTAF